ncbi:ABC transporter permease [Irregularibacter muris]|uniref:ABC transporter permease n=1 Tax=Irregularibacter muris TaxID=1796619 RepID=A0AAE3L002_9FIRM|nr:ABC transporter permease [Irregularibacter muris]MCR1899476.1 ABC transporter permease [Irregularibacter muris]
MIRLYGTRLKSLGRDRSNVFWTFLFPIILATLFNLALGNIYNTEAFHSIEVALVENDNYSYMKEFEKTLEDTTIENHGEDTKLFKVTKSDEDQAKTLLNNNKVIGYIEPGKEMNLVVKSSGIQQTIVKSFLEKYSQTLNTLESIGRTSPQSYGQALEDIGHLSSYISEVNLGKNPPDIILNFYYALIAMACLFGSFWGLKEIVSIQGDLSWKGARINITPLHKIKLLLCNMLAALTIHLIGILLLLAYLSLVLKIDFGKNLGYILLTCFMSCMLGISLGAMVGTLTKKNADFKNSVLAAIVMFSCFLAGLMMVEMKHIVATKLPFLQYLNPAHLITDAFYSLYYYETYSRFSLNIVLMLGYSLLFSLITYLLVRRMQYESL